MNILLTGYKGFIGQHLQKALIDEGHDLSVFEWGDNFPDIKNYEWVLHIGAISSTTEKDVEKVMRQNYDFTVKLFDECEKYKTNIQYSSSASVYELNTNFEEIAPVDPKTPYAWSKYLVERYHTSKPRTNIVQGFRYFNVYGPEGEEHKNDQASPYAKFTKEAIETGNITIFENSENYKRDFIHVSKIVELHLRFLNSNESGIWNFGTGNTKSFMEIAKEISTKYNATIKTKPMPINLRNNYQEFTCADTKKLTKTLSNIIKN